MTLTSSCIGCEGTHRFVNFKSLFWSFLCNLIGMNLCIGSFYQISWWLIVSALVLTSGLLNFFSTGRHLFRHHHMFLGMARHDENAPGALENKDAINVEEAVPEEMLGDDQTRHYKKGMWTVSELQVLQAVRREDFERQSKGGNREKHRSLYKESLDACNGIGKWHLNMINIWVSILNDITLFCSEICTWHVHALYCIFWVFFNLILCWLFGLVWKHENSKILSIAVSSLIETSFE